MMRLYKPGAAVFDAVTGAIVVTFRALNRPGARLLQKENQIARLLGAAWLAVFAVLLPLLVLKCIGGLLYAHDALYAWREL